MRSMKTRVAEPRRQALIEASCARRFREYSERLCEARVAVPANLGPLVANGYLILSQGMLVASPHSDSRMILPAISGVSERLHDLQSLDPLLTKPLHIEHGG